MKTSNHFKTPDHIQVTTFSIGPKYKIYPSGPFLFISLQLTRKEMASYKNND